MTRHKISLLCILLLTACAGQATPEDQQMSNAMCAQGKNLLAAGKPGEARDLYASATHRDSDNARAWNGLGVASDMLGKRVAAEDAYKEAVELAPHDLTALNNLAHLYLETGDAADAERLLAPHANDPDATATLKQNLAAAQKALRGADADSYADLGSFATEGMANAHLKEARTLLGGDAKELTFAVTPEVKVSGGTPVFTARITGKSAQDICDELNPQAFPCIPHGK